MMSVTLAGRIVAEHDRCWGPAPVRHRPNPPRRRPLPGRTGTNPSRDRSRTWCWRGT
ncbi:MAG: hypothetical protein ACRCY8_11920 [Dermatophilaceae bacterium]